MDQGSGMVTGGWVDDHPRWLVHHDQVWVVVNHREWNGLRSRLQDLDLRQLVLDEVAGSNSFGGASLTAVDPDTPGPYQPSRGGAAELRLQLSQGTVKPGVWAGDPQPARLPRTRYPASRRATPTEIAESATLKTGHQWSATKSVTVW